MISHNILKIEKNGINTVQIKHINLDSKLDFFLAISSNDTDYIKVLESKILDLVIDNISKKNTYKDFGHILEKINSILKIYNKQKNSNTFLNILIAVSNNKDFIFSQVGKPSLYLVKSLGETIEITDKNSKSKEFNYISEGYLEHNDILIIATNRLLDDLSYSDFIDSTKVLNVEKINKNIELIINEENKKSNIGLLSIKYFEKNNTNKTPSIINQKIEKYYYKIIDNNIVKITLAYFKILKEKIEKKSKLVKNMIFLTILLISSFFFFLILSKTIHTTQNNNDTIHYNNLLENAKKYQIIASNNYSNPEIFDLNISKVEEIIKQLKQKKLFLNQVKLLENNLNIIKKTYNGIETFNDNKDNIIYQIPLNLQNSITQTLSINSKNYIITKKGVIGPIIKDQKIQNHIFSQIGDDEFISATPFGNSIILLTKKGKIVEFNKAGYFSYKDVIGQDSWEKADSILSYAQNIYLIQQKKSQIIKHPAYGKTFKKATTYLKPKDQKYIGKIQDIAIDGGFYILKDDLKVLKFFSNPYRLEKIRLLKFPKTFKKQSNSKISLIARKDLNYVYILLNNKIWIAKPNTPFFKKTESLIYLGQIEGQNSKIIDFYVEKDGTINVLTNTGLFIIHFNENDGKILVNN